MRWAEGVVPHPAGDTNRTLMAANAERSGVTAWASSGSVGAVALSPRQQETLALIYVGEPTKAIAAALGISHGTVDTQIRRMFWKFGVHSRPALVARTLGSALRGGVNWRAMPHSGR